MKMNIDIINGPYTMLSTSSNDSIDTVILENLDYNIFFNKYMNNNVPCIIKNVSSTWGCTADWLKQDQINFDYLQQEFGKLTAPVANCDNISFNAQCKIEMTLFDYISYMKSDHKSKLLYLKDWHLKRLRPNAGYYNVPYIFASDWLNEFSLDTNEDDFMFVYIGPAKSWTPLHADVYNSFSWSVNVTGKKKWILFPPGEELKLKDSLGNLPLLFDNKLHTDIKYFEILQQKGDALFVPSGWHHQVVNMSDTISINHNSINACNLDVITSSLLENLNKVENEIADCKNSKEFIFQCQVILKAHYGMDLPGYINFLCYIANKRLKELIGETNLIFGLYTLGKNHLLYDLNCIMKNLQLILTHPLLMNQSLKSYIQYDVPVLIQTISAKLEKI